MSTLMRDDPQPHSEDPDQGPVHRPKQSVFNHQGEGRSIEERTDIHQYSDGEDITEEVRKRTHNRPLEAVLRYRLAYFTQRKRQLLIRLRNASN